jgi:hypothetical protein
MSLRRYTTVKWYTSMSLYIEEVGAGWFLLVKDEAGKVEILGYFSHDKLKYTAPPMPQ